MIVCVHVERTAGSSIHASFYSHFQDRYFVPNSLVDLDSACAAVAQTGEEKVYLGGHFGIKDLKERGVMPKISLLFSVVRDPVARLTSLYNLMRRNPDWLPELHALVQDGPLEAFFETCLQLGLHVGNLQCRRIGGEPRFEVAREAIRTHYHLVGCVEAMDVFTPALEAQVRRFAPAFSYIPGVASNAAPPVHGEVGPALAARIRADSSEDQKLFDWIRTDLCGLWRRDKQAGRR